METIIAFVIIAVILGSAIVYVCKAKKRGVKCIGCPSGCSCPSGGCGGNCGCCGCAEEK